MNKGIIKVLIFCLCLSIPIFLSGCTKTCETCSGEGTIDCSECSASGKVECPKCEGIGKEYCSKCDGSGERKTNYRKCEMCEGTGVDTAAWTSAEGWEKATDDILRAEKYGTLNQLFNSKRTLYPCKECNGQYVVYDIVECSSCNGEGYLKKACSTCKGEKEVQCEKCSGKGKVTCPDCNGEGEVEQ